KKGYNETMGGVKSATKTALSNQTYRDAWKSTVDYTKLAVKDPSAAVQKFGKGVSNASLQFGLSLSNSATQPVIWMSNIPNRSKEENLTGFGYGLWKGLELYSLLRLPKLLESLSSTSLVYYEGNEII